MEQRKKGEQKSPVTSTGSNLPALASLYHQHKQKNQQTYESLHPGNRLAPGAKRTATGAQADGCVKIGRTQRPMAHLVEIGGEELSEHHPTEDAKAASDYLDTLQAIEELSEYHPSADDIKEAEDHLATWESIKRHMDADA